MDTQYPQPPVYVNPKPGSVSFPSSLVPATQFVPQPPNPPPDNSWEVSHAQLRAAVNTNFQRSKTSYLH